MAGRDSRNAAPFQCNLKTGAVFYAGHRQPGTVKRAWLTELPARPQCLARMSDGEHLCAKMVTLASAMGRFRGSLPREKASRCERDSFRSHSRVCCHMRAHLVVSLPYKRDVHRPSSFQEIELRPRNRQVSKGNFDASVRQAFQDH